MSRLWLIPVIRAAKIKDSLQAPEALVDSQSKASPNVMEEEEENDSQNQEQWSHNSQTKSSQRKAEHKLT